MAKIAIISDLHIKSKDAANDFFLSDDEFHFRLLDLLKLVNKVILNGDIFELWQCRKSTKAAKMQELGNILREFPKSMGLLLSNPKIVMVVGNHDLVLFEEKNLLKEKYVKEFIYKNSKDEKILITHGISDIVNLKFPKVTEALSWAGGWFERILGSNIEIDSNNFLRKVLGINLFKNHIQIKKYNKVFNDDKKLKCVCVGHTHYPVVIKSTINEIDRHFINTGFYNGKKCHTTIIDTETWEILQNHNSYIDYTNVTRVIKKGDIILTYNKTSILSSTITQITKGKYSHSMVYVGMEKVIEATITRNKNGVMLSPLNNYMVSNHDILVLRLKDNSKINPFIKSLYQAIGRKYSILQLFIDLFYIILYRITKKDLRITLSIDIDGNKEICSELIAKSLNQVYHYNLAFATFTPQDFITRPDLFYKIYYQRV